MTAHATKSPPEFAPERAGLKSARRIVVKVGTSLLTSGGVHVDRRYIVRLAAAVGQLWTAGKQVAIVTSGAIGAGCGALGFKERPKSLPDRQACAAAGQVELMKLYAQAFRRLKTPHAPRSVGQLLLTRDGLEDRKRYLNARHTLEALFERRAVPIINENDTISVDEIRFGDNDTLSALVAVAAEAELLVILSDVEGLMNAPPRENPNARLIHEVPEITPEVESWASPSGSALGTGGMVSKLEAAKIVTGSGESMVLVGGSDPSVLERVLEGRRVGTYFAPRGDRMAARKRWLAYTQRTQGTIKVDAGARDALVKRHKSLLPSGIVSLEGHFDSGDLVALQGPDGRPFARGLSNYSRAEVEKIRGRKSSEIAKELGQLLFEEVVHRDNLVIL
ncbi:MAG: glutamate 5-kinase [Planctomycetes bacterium]|nr:glutamate 5-kinase [Planctomycetota bacterium]